MPRTHAVGAWLALASLAACGEPDPVLTVNELRPVVLPSCRPASPPSVLEVRALGDFPAAATDRLIELWTPEDGRLAIDRFPLETRMLSVRALGTWEAAGLFEVPEGDSVASVLLLPFDRACALMDPEIAAPDGAAVAALPDGGMLIAGGADASARVVRVFPAGGPLSEILARPLFNGRVHASATLAGERVFIVGGATEPTFEVFDLSAGSLDPDASGRLPGAARRRHGAVALAGERVLVVGGEDAAGEPLADAVIVAPSAARAVEDVLELARTDPSVLRLDDGRVFVAGGRNGAGTVVNAVEHFDVESEQLDTVVEAFDADALGVAVALPGSRIAWLAHGDARIEIMSFAQRDALTPELTETVLTEPLPATFASGEVAVLADGDILMAGQIVGGTVIRGRIIDPGTGEVRLLDDAVSPRRMVPLADGSVAELGTTGAWLRRRYLRTPFDNPPATLLPTDTDWLAFDAAARWDRGAAREDAFVHLPALRFRRVRITTHATGPADLFIRDEAGETARVVLDAERTEVGLCTLAHDAAEAVSVEVGDGAIVLRAGESEQRCELGLTGSVSLSWKLFAGSALESIRIERL